MSELTSPEPPLVPGAPLRAPAGAAPRIAAFFAAAVILSVGMALSFGTVLLAAIGMWVFAVLRRRAGRPATRTSSWLAANATAAVVIGCAALFVISRMPAGTTHKAIAAMDSASATAPKQPPPAWLERISPGATARASAPQPAFMRASGVRTAMMIWGLAMAVMFAALLYGTLGWVGGMFAGLAIDGHWPGSHERLPVPRALS
jgi:hypothetical protein